MSAAFQLTPQATEDLDSIWWFIEQDNREAADRIEMAIIATCQRLAEYPLIGHHRPDITPLPVRFWTLPKYSAQRRRTRGSAPQNVKTSRR